MLQSFTSSLNESMNEASFLNKECNQLDSLKKKFNKTVRKTRDMMIKYKRKSHLGSSAHKLAFSHEEQRVPKEVKREMEAISKSKDSWAQTAAMVDRRTAALRIGSGSGSSVHMWTSIHSRERLDFFTASTTAMTYWPSSKVAAEATASFTHPLLSSTRENASLNAETWKNYKIQLDFCMTLEVCKEFLTIRKRPLM